MMNNNSLLRYVGCTTMIMLLLQATAAWAQPESFDGHYYEVINSSNGAWNWEGASQDAQGRSHEGLCGHLVTITSEAENDFLTGDMNIPINSWIGGLQPPDTGEPNAGWEWVTGEAWSFTSWAGGEPNDSGGEDCAQWWTPDGTWNDISCGNGFDTYVIEYEACGQAAETRATFTVTKDFTDDNPSEVEVTISCNTGLPLEQSQEIDEGSSVEFVVVAFDAGEMDCDVSEVVPNGYSPTYSADSVDGVADSIESEDEGCHFLAIESGEFTCHIVNTPDPVDIDITKEWVFAGSSDADSIDTFYELTLYCDAEIVDGYEFGATQEGPGGSNIAIQPLCGLASFQESLQSHGGGPVDWCKSFYGDGPDDFTAQVIPEYPNSHCYVVESLYDSAVEVDNGCGNLVVSAGEGDSCTIVNTVFFEGIPTLNQYGLALLAMLMVGVGFVGFRRFA